MSTVAISICETVKIPEACTERFLPIGHAADDVLRRSGIGMGGYSRLVPGYAIGRIAPPYHVLIATVRGSGELLTPNGKQKIPEGSLLILPAQTSYLYSLSRGRWEIAWLHLSARCRWKRIVAEVSLRATPSPWLSDGIVGALNTGGRGDPSAKSAFTAYSELILAGVEEALGSMNAPPPSLLKLTAGIEGELQSEWSVAKMARRAHQSESTLARQFRHYYGMAPMKWLTTRRMERAAALLLRGDEPAYRIAELIGYNDPFAFSVAFKRWCGKSPTDYRRDWWLTPRS